MKSIQHKIVLMFSLLIVSIIIVVGSFLLVNLTRFYDREFTVMMEQVFTEDFVSQLEQSAKEQNGLEQVSRTIDSYIGPLGIDTYRFYCILDGTNASVLKTSDYYRSQNLTKSNNIILAMTGKRGNLTDFNRNYMDFAVPVKVEEQTRFVIYVKDMKDEVYSITKNVSMIILQALLLGAIISILIAFWLSRTITVTISLLTKQAERVASGEFDTMPNSDARDEIGTLTNTFQYMSSALHDTLEEVQSEKNKVETILQNMTDGIMAFNLEGILIHQNPEAKKMLAGHEIESFDAFVSALGVQISMGDLLYIRQDTPMEVQSETDTRVLRLTFATFRFENKIGGILVVMQDITKQEKLEISRREFVANVSHELRTPLTTVKSYAETLIDMSGEPDGMQTRFLNVILSEADRMTRIVKDLLTLSRLDEEQGAVRPSEPIDLKQFVGELVERISINAEKKQQSLTYTAINQTPVFYSDRDRLEQVLVNVLSNAIKYTAVGGKIEVYSGRIYNEIYVKVVDNGIGIPKENLTRIFERFYRVDKARSRETGGTGLGLAIAKQMMDNMGGNISISSVYGKGTEVTVTLPV